MRFKDSPEPPQPGSVAPGSENKVLHATFKVGNTLLHGSDGRCGGKATFQGFSLSLTVAPPLSRRFFAPSDRVGACRSPILFAAARMLTDRLGVLVSVTGSLIVFSGTKSHEIHAADLQ